MSIKSRRDGKHFKPEETEIKRLCVKNQKKKIMMMIMIMMMVIIITD
jgi:hypothetical protein